VRLQFGNLLTHIIRSEGFATARMNIWKSADSAEVSERTRSSRKCHT
jgi:hypothetical protein